MKAYGFQIILAFGMLALIAFAAKTFQTARNNYYVLLSLEEVQIEVPVVEPPQPGTIEYRIQECRHLIWVDGIINGTHIIGQLPKFLDCRDEAFDRQVMSRNDI